MMAAEVGATNRVQVYRIDTDQTTRSWELSCTYAQETANTEKRDASCGTPRSQLQSVSQLFHGLPPRAHPSAVSPSGSAAPGLTHKYRVLAPGGYSIIAS